MTNEEIKTKVNIMSAERDACIEEIKRLQGLCTHDRYHLGNFSWGPGCIDVVKICDYCNENLGSPEFEEGREFDKNQSFFTGIRYMTKEEQEEIAPKIYYNDPKDNDKKKKDK